MIILAGGTGTLGRLVAPLLLEHGAEVTTLARHASEGRVQVPSLSSVVADVRDPEALTAAMEGAHTVVSMIQGFAGPDALGPEVVDRDGNLRLIDAAVHSGVSRFILVSINQASSDHPIDLFRMKFAAEAALRSSGLAWTILRPTASMETWTEIVGRPLAETGRTRIFGRGQNPINFVAAADVARFVEHAIVEDAWGGEVVDIAGPEDLSFDRFATRVGEVIGRAGQIDHVPRIGLRVLGAALTPFRPVLAGQIRAALVMDTRDMTASTDARLRFGPSIPMTPLRDVIRLRLVDPTGAA